MSYEVDSRTSEHREFLNSLSSTSSERSDSSSSSEYVQPEEDAYTETEKEENCMDVTNRQFRRRKISIEASVRNTERTANRTSTPLMESSEQPQDPPQRLLRRDKERPPMQRLTRGSAKSTQKKQILEEEKGEGSEGVIVHVRKATPKKRGNVRAKRLGKQVPPTVVDAVNGNLEDCVADVEELRRKRDEDAQKCGRMTRTVPTTSNATTVHNELTTNFQNGPELNSTNSQLIDVSLKEKDSRLEQDLFADLDLQRPPRPLPIEDHVGVSDVQRRFVSAEIPPTDAGTNSARAKTIPITSPTSMMHRSTDTSVRENAEGHVFSVRGQAPVLPLANIRSSSSGRADDNNGVPSPVTGSVQFFVRLSSSLSMTSVVLRDSGLRVEKFQQNNSHQPRLLSFEKGLGTSQVEESAGGDWRTSRRRRRSRSNSPPYERGRIERFVERDFRGHKSRSPLRETMRTSGTRRGWQTAEDCFRRRSLDYSSSEGRDRRRSSPSPDRRRRRTSWSPTFRRNLSSPTTSMQRLPAEVRGTGDNAESFHVTKDVVVSSPSEERRRRRHKQTVRESQKVQRERQGKKPFFLTVDTEGRPFGPGRPSWISEINKLATALDPSCTDIRKQAHGDVCIFKDRLNEHFEYSAELNEHYLRGLMGKAVTRRRTDLIDYINKNGDRPKHFDKRIWERLEMLATSKQREKRTEHGRYANSCRKTLGRTGASGEDGVNLRLRQLLGRSPDPDEVAEEMQRDKGYGKLRGGSSSEIDKGRPENHDLLKIDDLRLRSQRTQLQRFSSEEYDLGKEDFEDKNPSPSSKGKEPWIEKHGGETEWNPEKRLAGGRSSGHDVSKKYSKDDYIAKLEGELRRMREAETKKSYYGRSM